MESFEAALSLMVALYAVSVFYTLAPVSYDYTLPQYLIAEDIWRVIYLRYGLSAFYVPSDIALNLSEDFDTITDLTALCIEYKTPSFEYISEYCPPKSGDVIVVREKRALPLEETVLLIGR